LERISAQDSTINIGLRGGGILQIRLQLADIDSIRLTKDNRTYKIIGIRK